MKNFWIIFACVSWFVIGLAVELYEQGSEAENNAQFHDGMQ